MDDRSVHVVVPTELNRGDPFLDMAFVILSALCTWYAFNMHVVWIAAPVLIVAAVWTMTGEPACDVPYIGAIASGLRSRLGLRRAHEWVAAWWHYTAVVTWPHFQDWSNERWQNSRLRSKMQTVTRSSAWQRITSASRISTRLHWSTPPWLQRHARPALAAAPLSDAGHEPLRPNL